MRRQFIAANAAALALSLLAARTEAAPVCHFLECAEGDTPTAPPPAIPKSTKPASPAARAATRPQQAGEICDVAGDLRYCVSSVLPPQFGFNYRPKNLVDGKYDTAWVPDTAKALDGIGESLIIDFGPNVSFRGLQLWNGYHKNESIFTKNNRVRELELTLPGEAPQTFEIDDGAKPISFTLDKAVFVPWVRLRILSVHRGTKYHDTALSEVRVVP